MPTDSTGCVPCIPTGHDNHWVFALVLQVLGREERSLAHLLRRYCGVTQDKTHQTADWRLRPLAPELHKYARTDVHWLPYLAALMVAELQARSPSTTGVSSWGGGPRGGGGPVFEQE
jgi:hypothetical protein